jgi:hypothetical protein
MSLFTIIMINARTLCRYWIDTSRGGRIDARTALSGA